LANISTQLRPLHSADKFKGGFIHPAEREVCITSRIQSVPPWLHIRISGAVSPPDLLHSQNWMCSPMLGLQIIVLGGQGPLLSHWQGLQQPHGFISASQGHAHSREQPSQRDFRPSILAGKQGDIEAWGDPHKANADEGRGPLVLTLTCPWGRLLEGSGGHSQHLISCTSCPARSVRKAAGTQVQIPLFLPCARANLRATIAFQASSQDISCRCPRARQEHWTTCTVIWDSEASPKVPGCAS